MDAYFRSALAYIQNPSLGFYCHIYSVPRELGKLALALYEAHHTGLNISFPLRQTDINR
jgi:hypothetical protein